MKFGVFLPSYLQGEPPRRHASRLRDFARHAEALGFDSLWITDHIVTAHRFYSVSWLDALIVIASLHHGSTDQAIGFNLSQVGAIRLAQARREARLLSALLRKRSRSIGLQKRSGGLR